MKRNSLVFLLLLVSFTSFSQKIKNDQNELKEIFFSIHDSTFSDNIFDFQNEERQIFWNLYLNGKYENVEMSNDRIYGTTNLMFRNDSINVDAFIDFKGKILRIMNRNTDAIPTCEVKIYNSCNRKVVGVTIKSSDHATTHTDEIVFYKYVNKEFKDITYEVLKSYNYFTDNYSDSTINILNSYYNCDLRSDRVTNKGLLYTFTSSDTVIISQSFFGYFIDPNENPGLDEKYFDGEFFTKKYIMDKKKLRLAE